MPHASLNSGLYRYGDQLHAAVTLPPIPIEYEADWIWSRCGGEEKSPCPRQESNPGHLRRLWL